MANPRKRRGTERAVRTTRTPVRLPAVLQDDIEERRPALVGGVALAAGVLLFLFLLRFAVDILLWVGVLALFAIVMHYLTLWLAESELLSAPWLLIVALTVGAATWMLWPESSFQQGLDVTAFLPVPAVRALEWAEERSLTRRALVTTFARGVGAGFAPAGDTTVGSAARSGSIVLTAVPATSRVGEPVTFVAIVSPSGSTPTGVVQFFDGPVLLAQVTLERAGGAGQASFTTTALPAGTHRITARCGGTTSPALMHAVAGG